MDSVLNTAVLGLLVRCYQPQNTLRQLGHVWNVVSLAITPLNNTRLRLSFRFQLEIATGSVIYTCKLNLL